MMALEHHNEDDDVVDTAPDVDVAVAVAVPSFSSFSMVPSMMLKDGEMMMMMMMMMMLLLMAEEVTTTTTTTLLPTGTMMTTMHEGVWRITLFAPPHSNRSRRRLVLVLVLVRMLWWSYSMD